MKPKKIKVWLARDNDGFYNGVGLYTKEPVLNGENVYYPQENSDCMSVEQDYGLEPGECVPATLVIGEE